MGSYACFSIGNFNFLYTKNNYFSLLNYFYDNEDFYIKENYEDDTTYKEYFFKTTVKKFRTSLDLMGNTLRKAQEEYDSNIENIWDIDIPEYMWDNDDLLKKYLKNKYSFKTWKKYASKCFDKLITGEIEQYPYIKGIDIPKTKSQCEKSILDSIFDCNSESFLGLYYDTYDIMNTLRVVLNEVDDNLEIYYDVTDLIDSGYCSVEEFMNIDEREISKTIVLVEGTTDKEIIEFAFKHIYPHYSKFFYFMDFDNPKRPGSASEITRIIKAFANSKIDNKFIALYDNDAAGKKEIFLLRENEVTFPENIKICTYPNIKFASQYPTMGVNRKIVNDDINGRAGSIEIYLPTRMLQDNSGKLYYVTWKSLDEKTREYQGEVSNKSEIFKHFLKYKHRVENNMEKFVVDEWTNMLKLIDSFVFDK